MEKATGRILKANDVNIQGSIRLDPGHQPRRQTSAGTAGICTPQAGIVEKNADFAVIEITCSCGTKTRIRCDYSNA